MNTKLTLALAAILLAGLLPATPAAAEDLAAGAWRAYPKGTAPEWKGELSQTYTLDQYSNFSAPQPHNGREALLAWAEAKPDKWGNKPSKFILLFTSAETGHPGQSAEEAKKWFEGKAEAQAGFVIECAPDVRQLVDLNAHDKGWSSVYLFVEHANGKRSLAPLTSCDKFEVGTDEAKLEKTVIRLPEDYKWPAQK